MQTLRIFISSPGDVAEERDRARQVVESLRRRYAGRFFLKPVIWEELPLQADMSFQQGIDLVLSKENGVDIAVFILWSRLGSPLGATIRKPDGTEYRSGTERELDLMLTARKQTGGTRPALMVYTRRDETSFDERLRGKPTKEKEDIIAQKKLVEEFIAEEFRDGGSGHNVRAYHSFDRPVTFSQRLRTHLTDLLDELAGGGVTESVWDIEKQGPPFLGLEAFQPGHADVFFGRETETLEARHALREQARNGCAFLLLSGASGSGKSSLARAGVLPAIVENELDEQVTLWRTLIATPLELGTDPLTGLVRRLAADEVLPDLRGDTEALEDLIEGLRRDPALTLRLRFKDAFARAAKRVGGGVRVLLVLDQLEELFATAAVSDTARREFLEAVEALARSGQIWVLATVRSDFWAQVQAQPALVRMTEGHGLLPVLPPETDALRRLIEEPARLAGLTFEQRADQSLADRILRDAATHAELLPLLEYVLRELFEQRTAQRVLTWEAYEKLGGVEGALAKRAEDVFKALPGDVQEALGSVLKALVTLGQEGSDGSSDQIVRQRVPLASLTTQAGAATLVQAFVQERLLTTANDPATAEATAEATVTVAHESLLRVWPRAIAWADHNRDFLRTRARVAARMREGSPLLEGDPLLEAAKGHLVANRAGFNEDQRNYVQHSIATAQRAANRIARRRRWAIVGLSMLSMIAIIAGIVAWHMKLEAAAQRDVARVQRDDAQFAGERMFEALRELESTLTKQELIIRQDVWLRLGLIEHFNLGEPTSASPNSVSFQEKALHGLISANLEKDAAACGLEYLTDPNALTRRLTEIRHQGRYRWLPEIEARFPVVITLILEAESMNQDRQVWLDKLPRMTRSECASLLFILLKERRSLDSVELNYKSEKELLALRIKRKAITAIREKRAEGKVSPEGFVEALFADRDSVAVAEVEEALGIYASLPHDAKQRLLPLTARAYTWLERWDEAKELIPYIALNDDIDKASHVSDALSDLMKKAGEANDHDVARAIFNIWKKVDSPNAARAAIALETNAGEWVFGDEPYAIILPALQSEFLQASAPEKRREALKDVLRTLRNLATIALNSGPAGYAQAELRAKEAFDLCKDSEGKVWASSEVRNELESCARKLNHVLSMTKPDGHPHHITVQRELVRICEAKRADADALDVYARKALEEKLVSEANSLCWHLIFARDFKGAVAAADAALKWKPSLMLEGNRAHALLLSGQFDAARIIHLAHCDEPLGKDMTWKQMVKDDFAAFRAQGITHPDMSKIEALFSIIPADTKK